MINESNFDWTLTDRKLTVFIPNFKRKKYLLHTIPAITTALPLKNWLIVIVNDGIHEDLSRLNEFNCVYFTLRRKIMNFRTTANVRNYFIKRTKSELLFQTEPDVWLRGDFLSNFVSYAKPYRLGNHAYLGPLATRKFLKTPNIDLNKLKKYPKTLIGKTSPNKVWYFHQGYGINPDILRNMRGYDEDFKKYGCEDSDLFDRLKAQRVSFFCDNDCTSIHLWHKRPKKSDLQHSKSIRKIKKKQINKKRNPNGWGNG